MLRQPATTSKAQKKKLPVNSLSVTESASRAEQQMMKCDVDKMWKETGQQEDLEEAEHDVTRS